jgi:hypothetical protein
MQAKLHRWAAADPGCRCRCMPVLNRICRDPRSRPANEPPTDDQGARPPSGDQAELLMTCYLSAELGETLRFPVSGIEDYVPDVQRGQWSPQALVDQAKLHSIEKQPGPQG